MRRTPRLFFAGCVLLLPILLHALPASAKGAREAGAMIVLPLGRDGADRPVTHKTPRSHKLTPKEVVRLDARFRDLSRALLASRGVRVWSTEATRDALKKQEPPTTWARRNEDRVELGRKLGVQYILAASLGWDERWETLQFDLVAVEDGVLWKQTLDTVSTKQGETKDAEAILASVLADVGLPPTARPDPRPTSKSARFDYEWVHLPGGTFTSGCFKGDVMCSPEDKEETRRATVAPFILGKFEVTAGQYRACHAAGACSMPPDDRDGSAGWLAGDRHPMNLVSRGEAETFCKAVGGRLPTSLEWEYAARSGTDNLFPWGNGPPTSRRLNACDRRCVELEPTYADRGRDDGYAATAPVGSYPEGATPWGIHDLAGNVSEYVTSDGEYETGGHSYRAWAIGWLRGSSRGLVEDHAAARHAEQGFRCARDVP